MEVCAYSWIIFMSVWAFAAMGYDKRRQKEKETYTRKEFMDACIYWWRNRCLFWNANISS